LPFGTVTLRRELEQLGDRWSLPQESPVRLEQLLLELARNPEAPTSVKDPMRGVGVHIADSLSALQVDGFRNLTRIADIGSGAGFPGLALALALPGSRFDLIEATGRKCVFLERIVDRLRIENARVVCDRVEVWAASEGAEAYSGVVVRAVGSLATLLEYSAPILELGGKLVALKGRRDPDEERQAEAASSVLGMRLVSVEWVGPYAGSKNRHIYSYDKAAPTPPRFPRRPGMARKRPLGG
jgi:16S rRNA (guanine527-N7)-methyltransferase